MAKNAPSSYGKDIRCYTDADALFSTVTGVDLVKQDAFHRITTDSVLGPGGDGWGFDCRRLLGMSTRVLAGMQPFLSEVLQRDDRIQSADVTLAATTTRGLADVIIKAACVTEEGPFELVMSVQDLTAGILEARGQ